MNTTDPSSISATKKYPMLWAGNVTDDDWNVEIPGAGGTLLGVL
jgi:hypothetical protein